MASRRVQVASGSNPKKTPAQQTDSSNALPTTSTFHETDDNLINITSLPTPSVREDSDLNNKHQLLTGLHTLLKQYQDMLQVQKQMVHDFPGQTPSGRASTPDNVSIVTSTPKVPTHQKQNDSEKMTSRQAKQMEEFTSLCVNGDQDMRTMSTRQPLNGMASQLYQLKHQVEQNMRQQCSDNLPSQSSPPVQNTVRQSQGNPFARRGVVSVSEPEITPVPVPMEEDTVRNKSPAKSRHTLGVGAVLGNMLTGQTSYTATGDITNNPPLPATAHRDLQQRPYKRVIQEPLKSKPEKISKNEESISSFIDDLRLLYPDCPENIIELFRDRFCPLCLAPVNSFQSVMLHYNGRKHQCKLSFYGMDHGVYVINQSELENRHAQRESTPALKTKSKYCTKTRCHVCLVNFTTEQEADYHYEGDSHIEEMAELKMTCNKQNQFYCEICNIYTSSEEILQSHYRGKKHKYVLDGLREPVAYNVRSSTSIPNSNGESFYCSTCNILTISKELLDIHYVGKRHTARLQQVNHEQHRAKKLADFDKLHPSTKPTRNPQMLTKLRKGLERCYADIPDNLIDLIADLYCPFCACQIDSTPHSIEHYNSTVHQDKLEFYGLPKSVYPLQLDDEQLNKISQGHQAPPPPVDKYEEVGMDGPELRKHLIQADPMIPDTLLDMVSEMYCPFCCTYLDDLVHISRHYHSDAHVDKMTFYGVFFTPYPRDLTNLVKKGFVDLSHGPSTSGTATTSNETRDCSRKNNELKMTDTFCEVCNVNFLLPNLANRHYSSQRHNINFQKLSEYANYEQAQEGTQQGEWTEDSASKEQYGAVRTNQPKPLMDQVLTKVPAIVPDIPPKKFLNEKSVKDRFNELHDNLVLLLKNNSCYFCMTHFDGPKEVISHFNSQEHQKTLEVHEMKTGLFSGELDDPLLEMIRSHIDPNQDGLSQNVEPVEDFSSQSNTKTLADPTDQSKNANPPKNTEEEQLASLPDNLMDLIRDKFCPFCMEQCVTTKAVLDHYNSEKHQEKIDFYGMFPGLFKGELSDPLVALVMTIDQ